MKGPILVLINTMANGGAQRQVSLFAAELDQMGWDVTIMHYGSNGFAVEGLAELGVEVIKLESRGPFRRLLVAMSCLRWIRKHRPSLVVSFLDATNQLCGLLRFLGFSFNWVPSERNLTSTASTFESVWRKLLYRRASLVTCNSDAQTSWIRKLGIRTRVVTVPNGIAQNFFKSRTYRKGSAPYRFLVLARLGAQKNPWVLIRALKLLREKPVPEFHIDWFGDDDPSAPQLRQQLEAEAVEHSLPIQFHSATRNVAEQLDSADCLVLPSRFEGTPNVMLEAMARSVPCVASAVSDIPEILGAGERGWLFESDDESDLARALVDFMAAPASQVADKATRGQQHVRERFSTRRMALSYVDQIDT